jgi:hypothetical protein
MRQLVLVAALLNLWIFPSLFGSLGSVIFNLIYCMAMAFFGYHVSCIKALERRSVHFARSTSVDATSCRL